MDHKLAFSHILALNNLIILQKNEELFYNGFRKYDAMCEHFVKINLEYLKFTS